MIRLGSLAGYPFEGPRVLAGWTPPAAAAVYAILVRPEADAKGEQYAVIYVDHSEDLSAERFPFNHPRAGCWLRRAGDRFKLAICTYEVPGGLPSHREQIVRELTAHLPAELQHRAVRRRVEGPVDRRLPSADRRPPQHSPRPPRLNLLARAGLWHPLAPRKPVTGCSRPPRGSGSGECPTRASPKDAPRSTAGTSRRRRCLRPCRRAAATRRR